MTMPLDGGGTLLDMARLLERIHNPQPQLWL